MSLPPRFLKGCIGVSGLLLAIGLVMHLALPKVAKDAEFELEKESKETVAPVVQGKAKPANGGADIDVVAMLDEIGRAHALLTAKFARDADAAAPPSLPPFQTRTVVQSVVV